jgi:hypothetical protein
MMYRLCREKLMLFIMAISEYFMRGGGSDEGDWFSKYPPKILN